MNTNTRAIVKKAIILWVISSFLFWSLAAAAPQGGVVTAGSAAISQNGNVTTINQGSQNAVINWQGFNTASNEQVNFVQPATSSIALNRVTSGQPTSFAGLLTANGNVWVINPAGVLFTSTSRVDVSGLLASTLNISDSDFMNGHYQFNQVPGYSNGSVINNGSITIENSGLAALVAPQVQNNGLIQANMGKVVLASGTAVALDLYGDNLITFAANSAGQNPNGLVSNTGTIQANGGNVLLSANAVADVATNVVNMSGVIQADNAISSPNGVVILGGDSGTTNISGSIHSNRIIVKGHNTVVSGNLTTPAGGFIETSGDTVDLADSAVINAGQGGTWYLDPTYLCITDGSSCTIFGSTGTRVTISSVVNAINSGTTFTAIADSAILVESGAGGIFATGPGNLTLQAPNIYITAPITLGSGTLFSNAANGFTALFSSISTQGQIIFQGTTNIGSDSSVTNTGSSNFINFNGAVIGNTSGGQALAISTQNVVNFYGNVGQGTPLSSLTIARGLANFLDITSQVNTTDSQFYQSGATVAAPTTTFNAGGLVSFNGLNGVSSGAQSVAINSNSAAFNSNVGNNASLNSLTLSSGDSTTIGGNITTTGNQTYGGTISLSNNATLTGNTIIFNGALSSPGNSSLNIVGNTNINTGSINTGSGNQTYNGGITLLNSSTLSGSTVTFNGAVDGTSTDGQSLTLSGNAVFNGNVGANTRLNSVGQSGGNITFQSGAHTFNTGAAQNFSNSTNWQFSSLNLISPNGITLSTVNDSSGALTLTGNATLNGAINLSSLTDNGTTAINTNSITTSGNQIYNGALSLLNSPTLTGSAITFNGAINNQNSASPQSLALASNNTINLNGEVGGGANGALQSFNINSGNLIINTDLINTVNAQSYNSLNSSNWLSPSLTLRSPNGITLSAIDDSNGALTLTGNAVLNGVINLNSLNITGTTNINTGIITTFGNQTYGNAVNISPSGLNLTGNVITFGNTLSSSGSTNLNITGNAVFNRNVGSSSPNSLSISGSTTINGNTEIDTNEAQNYQGPVTISSSASLFGSAIIFGSTIDGPGSLTATSNVGTTLTGAIGSINPLSFINIAAGGSININANAINTTGAQAYNGAVVLSSSPTLTSGGNVIFDGVILNQNTTAQDLTIQAGSNNVYLNDSVGTSNSPLNSFSVTGNLFIQGNTNLISTINSQTYNGMLNWTTPSLTLESQSGLVTLGTVNNTSGDLTITGNALLNGGVSVNSLDITGATTIAAPSITTVTTQTYHNPVTLMTSSSPVLTGTTVAFGGTLDGAADLSIAGNAEFDGAVGNNTALNSLSVSGTSLINTDVVKTTGMQTYNGAVVLSSSPTLISGGNITFDSTIANQNATSQDLTIQAGSNNVYLNDSVGTSLSPLNSFSVTGNLFIQGNTNLISTINSQTYNGSLNWATPALNLESQSGLVTLGTVNNNSGDLTITGNALLNGGVSVNSLDITGATTIATPSITTVTTQTYHNPVTLMASSSPVLTGSTVTFDSTVDGAADLSIAGNAEFDGEVGNNTALSSLNVSGASLINTDVVKTTGMQNYTGAVTLANSSAALTGNVITFGNTVDGAADLSINGNAEFDAEVGNATALNSLNISGTSTINTDKINTTGTQTYAGEMTLSNSPTLTGSSVILTGVDGNQDLILNVDSNGSAQLNGPVGFTTQLNSLTVNGGSLIINTNLINTNAAQAYTLTTSNWLSPSLTLESPNGVTLGAVDNSGALTIMGNGVLNGNVGNSTPLNSLTITGTSTLNAPIIHTTGAQTYTGAVTLVDPTMTGSLITFGSTVDGAAPLTINGDVIFNGDVGSTTPLSALTINGDATTGSGVGIVATTGNHLYDGMLTLNSGSVTLSSSAGSLTFGPSVHGAGNSLNLLSNAGITNGDMDAMFVHELTIGGAGGSNLHGVIINSDTGELSGEQASINTLRLTSDIYSFQVNGFPVRPIPVLPPFIFDPIIPNVTNSPDQFFTQDNEPNPSDEPVLIDQNLMDDSYDEDSNGNKAVGVVTCVFGFATVVDSHGGERILMPGDKVYAHEKIVTDNASRIRLQTSKGAVVNVSADKMYKL